MIKKPRKPSKSVQILESATIEAAPVVRSEIQDLSPQSTGFKDLRDMFRSYFKAEEELKKSGTVLPPFGSSEYWKALADRMKSIQQKI